MGGRTRSLVIDPTNPQRMWAGSVGGGVWRSTNGGATFTDATGAGASGLPSIPVRGFAVDPVAPTRWFAGTEWGVYHTRNSGASWYPMLGGPPAVNVDELFVVPNSRRLLAATHGRGMWSADLATPNPDLDGDGAVDASDLAMLLASFGPCANCAADLDGNGSVGAGDLAILLGNWG